MIKHTILNRIQTGDFKFRWHYIRNISKKGSCFRKIKNKNKLCNFNNLKQNDNKIYLICSECKTIILLYKDEKKYFNECPYCYRKENLIKIIK